MKHIHLKTIVIAIILCMSSAIAMAQPGPDKGDDPRPVKKTNELPPYGGIGKNQYDRFPDKPADQYVQPPAQPKTPANQNGQSLGQISIANPKIKLLAQPTTPASQYFKPPAQPKTPANQNVQPLVQTPKPNNDIVPSGYVPKEKRKIQKLDNEFNQKSLNSRQKNEITKVQDIAKLKKEAGITSRPRIQRQDAVRENLNEKVVTSQKNTQNKVVKKGTITKEEQARKLAAEAAAKANKKKSLKQR